MTCAARTTARNEICCLVTCEIALKNASRAAKRTARRCEQRVAEEKQYSSSDFVKIRSNFFFGNLVHGSNRSVAIISVPIPIIMLTNCYFAQDTDQDSDTLRLP